MAANAASGREATSRDQKPLAGECEFRYDYPAMPIDAPIGQAKALIASDERLRSPGAKVVAGLLKLCNATPVLKALFGAVTPLA
jgi:enoyl reductase-like protein